MQTLSYTEIKTFNIVRQLTVQQFKREYNQPSKLLNLYCILKHKKQKPFSINQYHNWDYLLALHPRTVLLLMTPCNESTKIKITKDKQLTLKGM